MTAARLRGVGWMLAGLGAVGSSLVWQPAERWADSVGLAVLGGATGGFLVEAILLGVGQIRTKGSAPQPPVGALPADGVVDVWSMAGVVGLDPLDSVPWRRFVRLDGISAHPADTRGQPTRLLARNPKLLGRVALISVFVGRDGHSWTDREIEAAHRSLQAVGRWVEREAIHWQAPVNVGLVETYFQTDDDHEAPVELDFVAEGDDFGPLEADATTKSMAGASRVAAALGFTDVADLVARVNPLIRADAHVWLLHLKRRGRSHAIPAGDRVVAGVGLALCYAREASFPEPLIGSGRVDPITVAHEMLHLFGGTDKYGVALAQFPAGQVARNDIMRLHESALRRLQVGPLTAREIGWAAE